MIFCLIHSDPGMCVRNYVTPRVTELLRVNQGSGPGEIGVITPSEANPEGPMSFVVGANREVYILDQLNRRVQVFKNGKKVQTIAIPGETFVDMELTGSGDIVLLDNLVKKSVYVMDTQGKRIKAISLEGRQIPHAGEIVGIQVVEAGKWAGIWAHMEGRSVRIANLDASEAERISVPGKFSQDGTRILDVRKTGEATASLYVFQKDSLSQYETRDIFLGGDFGILGLDSDRRGRIYLAVLLEGSEHRTHEPARCIVVIDSGLREVGRFRIPLPKTPHETHRPTRVSPEGKVYCLDVHEKSVRVVQFEMPAP